MEPQEKLPLYSPSPLAPATQGEGNREEGPGGEERAEVSSDSRGKSQVVLSYREKPYSEMGRLGVKGLDPKLPLQG